MQNTLRREENTNQEVLYKRIRIFIQTIYRNDKASASLSTHISTLKGIKLSKANALTGKILIIFDETMIDEYEIKKMIYTFIQKNNLNHQSNIVELEAYKKERAPIEKADRINLTQCAQYTDDKPPFHIMDRNEMEEILNTNLDSGLSEKISRDLVKKIGYNVLSEKKKKSIFAKIIDNLFDFSTRLLLGVGVISFFIGQIPDAIAIFSIVAIQTILSTIQQHKAESSISSLKDMMVHKARVIRDGKEQVIATKYLVPGDILLVESGDKIPADARIIECYDFSTTEATLTGESTPVNKCTDVCEKNSQLGDRHNMIFMGTNVLCGRAKAVVTSTGMNTEIGKIATMLQNIQQESAPIQNKINHLTKNITRIAIGACLLIIGFGLMSGRSLAEVLIMSICFSIGAIPESLPAVVSASMALSVQRMANKNAIVRRLPAVETLGSTDVICCDKTGTLTMNEMTVKKIYTDNSFYNVTGSGYSPKGKITLQQGNISSKKSLEQLLKAGILCSNACLINADNQWSVQGDPTEGALITLAHKHGMDVKSIEKDYQRLQEIPFDSSRLCMTTVMKNNTETIAVTKGACGVIFDKCTSVYEYGIEKQFTEADKQKVLSICEELGNQALRVLAFGYKQIDLEQIDLENDFVFLGLVAMEDPARDGVKESVQKCHRAGIKVVMITGDNKNTAAAIGRQLGILTDGIVITGNELEKMTDAELQLNINKIQVFARTCPEHKHRIVKALKKAGHIVAMIGDGVNDTPAMKEANIGVAMGKNGSDVAKDVADITLVDDDFSTIVTAIQEGRAVTNNIRNSIKYLLAGAFGEVAAILLSAAIFGLSPLLSIQILWVNVISETIMGSSLAVEPPSEDVMNHKPNGKNTQLLDKTLFAQIFKRGMLIGLTTFSVFSGAMFLGLGLAKARTVAFSTIILTQLANVYACRSNKKTKPNRYMNVAALASLSCLAGIIYLPSLGSFFGTMPLNMADVAAVGAATSISTI